jgi:hypothetical protein
MASAMLCGGAVMLKAACLAALLLAACGSSLVGPDGSATGTGGTGGETACQAAIAVDHTCATDSDCVAVAHTTNCCGQAVFIGIRASEQARFNAFEAQCDAAYPACGCAAGQPMTEDGSLVRFGDPAAAMCLLGRCTSYVPACGNPCSSQTTCFTCTNHGATFAACTRMCTTSADCTDQSMPLCQFGQTGNAIGMFCTGASVACDTQ